jgi:alanine racemase
MHRLGFEPADIETLIQKLQNLNAVKVRSVFSHLAGADNPALDHFTHQQAATFLLCADKITAAFSHKILRHLLNSSGIERFPQYRFDMVRLGIGHYGISAVNSAALKTVCTLKTVILQIKTIKAGETAGYNRSGKITRDSRIAVLPLGYADGYDRRLGNGNAEVFINGKRAKTVGNICMDLTMVDVTNITASEGDTVEIWGDHIPVAELAASLQTIPYEILTGISRRVKRVYYQE